MPKVAIVGRPNVGKSTLFNRLTGKRLAIVHDRPGVTRDRREGAARLYDLRFELVDTAGLDEAAPESLEGRMSAQSEAAVAEADVALFLIDARAGVTPLDSHWATSLRKGSTPVVLVANKCEGRAATAGLAESYGLGLGEPVELSAEHGLGLVDLRDALAERFAALDAAPEIEAARDREGEQDVEEEEGGAGRALNLAVVGRPNAGKSTLINRLIGRDRLLTGPEAGITRDSIAVDWSYKGRAIRLWDTAGLRRKARVGESLERLAVGDTLRAVRFAHVVVLLVDAELGIEKQDLAIARLTIEEGRSLVIGLSKWDACADRQDTLRRLRDRLERSLPQTRGVALVPLSGLTGHNCERLMDAVLQSYDVWNKRIPTAQLNAWLQAMVAQHPPPAPGGRRIRLKYATQAKTRPPTVAIFCSHPEALPAAYLRYLENGLREHFALPGVPLRLHLRKGANPYAGRRKR